MIYAQKVTLGLRQNYRHFADDIFKSIFIENIWISLTISLEFLPKIQINNILALVQAIMYINDGLFTAVYIRHSASMSWLYHVKLCHLDIKFLRILIIDDFYLDGCVCP